jgi:hypothetical protein
MLNQAAAVFGSPAACRAERAAASPCRRQQAGRRCGVLLMKLLRRPCAAQRRLGQAAA